MSIPPQPHPGLGDAQATQGYTAHYDGEVVRVPLEFGVECDDEVEVLLNFNRHRDFVLVDDAGAPVRPLDFSDDVGAADGGLLSLCYAFKFRRSYRVNMLYRFSAEGGGGARGVEDTQQLIVLCTYTINGTRRRVVFAHRYRVARVLDVHVTQSEISETSSLSNELRNVTLQNVASHAIQAKIPLTFEKIQQLRSYRHKLVKVNLTYRGAVTKDDNVDITEYSKLRGESRRYRFGVYYTYESPGGKTPWVLSGAQPDPAADLLARHLFAVRAGDQRRRSRGGGDGQDEDDAFVQYVNSAERRVGVEQEQEEDDQANRAEEPLEINQQIYVALKLHRAALLFVFDL